MKKVFFMILIVVAAAFGKDYTLKECVDIALKNNLNLMKSKLDKRLAELDLKSVKSSFLGIRGAYDGEIFFSKSKFSNFDDNLNDYNYTDSDDFTNRLSLSITANLSLPLIDRYKSSSLGIEYAENNLESVRDNLIYSVTTSFYNCILAREDINVQKENIKYNQTQYDETKLRYDLGSLTKSELLQAEVNLSTARLNIINSEKRYEIVVQNLINLLNIDESYKQFNPVYEIPQKVTIENLDLEKLIEIGLKNRIDVKNAELSLEQNSLLYDIEFDGIFPSVSASFNNSYSTSNDKETQSLDHILSATLNWDLTFEDFNRMDKQKVSLKKSELSYKQIISNAKNEITKTYLELIQQKENLDRVGKHVELAKENLDLANEMFRFGNKTITDRIKAMNDYIQSKYREIQARYEYITSLAKLRNSINIDSF
ncbi:MAG: hypothetical protein CR982_05740 [Candidatus Cloacimonadota bacterium]|nr:MAG: hypothetical protein CR982_05740 [Candidatus Cloacimonadota bacterium]PIE81377.1 MAG: hypothetical protein CSA15_00630 [Candidatus Delongbacteria bacterium]